MRRIISLAAAVAALRPELRGEEIPGENGWEVTCRLQLEVPPAFTLYHKGDLYFTAFTAAGLDGVYRIKAGLKIKKNDILVKFEILVKNWNGIFNLELRIITKTVTRPNQSSFSTSCPGQTPSTQFPTKYSVPVGLAFLLDFSPKIKTTDASLFSMRTTHREQ